MNDKIEDEEIEQPAKGIRRNRVRFGETYRHARRNGWRLLNKQMVVEGLPRISWMTFNQPSSHGVGARPALYSRHKIRGRTWQNALHDGEKNRRFRQEQKRGLHEAVV